MQLQVDRFGLYEVRRFTNAKLIEIAADYPPEHEYQNLHDGPVLVDLRVTYDLKHFKAMDKEYGAEIPAEISETPYHHVTYYLERSQLDRFLAFVSHGSIMPGVKVVVEHMETMAGEAYRDLYDWFGTQTLPGGLGIPGSPLATEIRSLV